LSARSSQQARWHLACRPKIVATAGPACSDQRTLTDMITRGADAFRLNFSHGTHADHARYVEMIRAAADEAGKPVAIIQDLQGPRLRTGPLKGGEKFQLERGDRVTIVPGDFEGSAEKLSTNYERLPEEVEPGDKILLRDGMIELKVREVQGREVRCEVALGGMLGEHQGINLPGVDLSISSPTQKDLEDLQFAVEHELDYIALSFVRGRDDVRRVKEELDAQGADIPVIAKIEKPEAVRRLEGIVKASDGIMVARGDLGIEMRAEDVPVAQKRIIRTSNAHAVPVITATQMLESMVEQPRPTRAEASDVANAILDGTDAVMLSGETAIGKHPAKTVEMMRLIGERTRRLLRDQAFAAYPPPDLSGQTETEAVAVAACAAAEDLNARAVVVFTLTGTTARYISQRRPTMPVFALTPNPATEKRLALLWGVIPVRVPVFESTDQMIQQGDRRLQGLGLTKTGDTVVCVAGASTNTPGGTDMLKIHSVGG